MGITVFLIASKLTETGHLLLKKLSADDSKENIFANVQPGSDRKSFRCHA